MIYIIYCDRKKNILYSSSIEHICFFYEVICIKDDLNYMGVKYKIHQKDGLLYSFEYLGWYD